MSHPDWAEWIWRLGRFIPVINQNLNPKVVTERMKTLTFDGSKLIEKSGITFHNTLDVISRTDPTYPTPRNKMKTDKLQSFLSDTAASAASLPRSRCNRAVCRPVAL